MVELFEEAYRERLALEFNEWCGESDINLDDFLDNWQKRMIIDWWIGKWAELPERPFVKKAEERRKIQEIHEELMKGIELVPRTD